MPVVFSPFVKELLDYAWSIAQVYQNAQVTPAHALLALLKHHAQGYVQRYIEQKVHLIQFKQMLLQEIQALPTQTTDLPALTEGGYSLDLKMEMSVKDAYSEAEKYNSDIILPEYFFLSLLKHHHFAHLDYQEAQIFIAQKNIHLIQQHQEINWGRQDVWLRIAKELDKLYEAGNIPLKPYLHQAFQATTGLIRSFVLLIEDASKAHKITIELISNVYKEASIEQTLRFLNHRKYPLEESFLYECDTNAWTKITILPKEILQESGSISHLLSIDLAHLLH